MFKNANENSEPTRFWESVKHDSDVRDMIFGSFDIVLMVVISWIYYVVKSFFCSPCFYFLLCSFNMKSHGYKK